MTPSSRLTAIICIGYLALVGCSKTADTAPETRVFGDPPVIQLATTMVDTNAVASCDFTNMFLASRGFCDDYPMPLGAITVESKYTEVVINATVTDPNDPAPPSTATDVLLVSASYVTEGNGTPTEDTIVMFDDGSTISFPFGQKDNRLEDCTAPMNNKCTCNKAFFDVTSNDLTAADDVFTRSYAFTPGGNIPVNMDGLYLDCIAMDKGQASQISADLANRTTPLDFRIEAVDRSGNLTEATNRPSATVGQGGLTCSGDPCACCLLLNQVNPADPVSNGGCFGLDGMMFDSGSPKRCEPGTVDIKLNTIPPRVETFSRDETLFGVLCSTNDDCCSPGDCCSSSPDPNVCGGSRDHAAGLCTQSLFARRCPNGFCKSTGCLR